VQRYKGSKRDVEALIVQGEVLMQLKRRSEARATFELAIKRWLLEHEGAI
jgi:predicted negative regulator of RcsB-dependent stress response